MKTLYESILGNTKDRVKSAKTDIQKMMLFGNVFKLKTVRRLTSKSAQCISVKGMKNLTKGMDYMDENVERGIFDRQNKVKMLCNWIEHIDLMEWGFSDVDWINDRNRRREFGLKLCETLELNGGFNSDGHCWVSMCSFETKNDGLILMFDKRGSAIGECFSLTFELR